MKYQYEGNKVTCPDGSWMDSIDEYVEELNELERENAELRRDKERLDWLLERYCIRDCNTTAIDLYNRDDIDEAMQEEA